MCAARSPPGTVRKGRKQAEFGAKPWADKPKKRGPTAASSPDFKQGKKEERAAVGKQENWSSSQLQGKKLKGRLKRKEQRGNQKKTPLSIANSTKKFVGGGSTKRKKGTKSF